MYLKKILIATGNIGKFKELSSFLFGLPLKIVSLSDLEIEEEIEETGKTYRENSQKKATFYATLSGLPTIADDGGIEIDFLGGAPGVRSRRFFGNGEKDATDEEIIQKVTTLLEKIPEDKRGAKFKTVVTLALPASLSASPQGEQGGSNGKVFSATGQVKGILKKSSLKPLQGYPYRSFFYLPKIKKYYHEDELTDSEEKVYNHRYKAIQKLKLIIVKTLGRKYLNDK